MGNGPGNTTRMANKLERQRYARAPSSSKSKDTILKRAKAAGRKVLWKDRDDNWHAATDRFNTPQDAVETMDIE